MRNNATLAAIAVVITVSVVACAQRPPACSLDTETGQPSDAEMTVREIRRVAVHYAAFAAAQIRPDPRATESKYQSDISTEQRARYYCEATLIKERATGPDARRDLAAKVAPGDVNLLVWLGVSAAPR